MCLFHGQCKIYNGQEHKDNGLDETYQNPQEQHGQRGKKETRKRKQDADDRLFRKDVAKEPDTQRHDAGQMADRLNNEH